MSWITIFGLVMKVALAVADILRDRKLIEAGEAIAIKKSLEETNARVEKARAARAGAAVTRMSDDDPYLRD
jgi:hypothetical protein